MSLPHPQTSALHINSSPVFALLGLFFSLLLPISHPLGSFHGSTARRVLSHLLPRISLLGIDNRVSSTPPRQTALTSFYADIQPVFGRVHISLLSSFARLLSLYSELLPLTSSL